MRTPEEYKQSLRAMRPNVYKFGKLIEDVTTHPSTRRCIEGHAQSYEAVQDPEHSELLIAKSGLTGETASRYLTILRSAEDMVANTRLKRLMFNLTGTCTGGRCVGWNALNAMWAATWDMDGELGTGYHQRLREWLIDAQRRDITLCGALTDPKGDRSLPPHRQDDPDMNLRVVKERPDGIVVRGAKVMIAGAAAANEVFVLPGTGYGESDADYAVSFAIPRDAEGLTVVEARHPGDGRDEEEGFDNPVSCGGITQGYLFFEDVLVPKERVFMCRETGHTSGSVLNFIAPYRSAIGGCVAGQGDVMIGAAVLSARTSGIPDKALREKVVQMAIGNETTFGMGIAASVMGERHPSGLWLPDRLMANVNKVHVATLPYETKRLAQDIAGGIGETGCMPSSADLEHPELGRLVAKYLKAASPAETRMKAARLVEWLTMGAGVPGCMHGGGSPDGAKMLVRRDIPLERNVELAMRLAGIEDDVPPTGVAK